MKVQQKGNWIKVIVFAGKSVARVLVMEQLNNNFNQNFIFVLRNLSRMCK